MEKLVSIISPCFNGEKYISYYLESVLAQSYSNIELILVNDASTDSTEDIVKSYIPKFEGRGYSLIYIRQEENKGQAAAINQGLKIFSGEYFTWMDSDDIYYKNAIKNKVEYLEQNPNIDFVVNWGEIVNSSNLNKRRGILKREKPEGTDEFFKDLIDEHNVVFCPGSIFVRTQIIKELIKNLQIYESREGQNWQLMLPLAYSCKCGYLEQILFKYVIHNDSHSHLKRTYEMEVKRRNNFFVLQKETINNMEAMKETDKEKWIKYSYDKQLKEKYILALHFRKKKEYCLFRKELMERNVVFPVNIAYPIYPLYELCKKIKAKIKSILFCIKVNRNRSL